MVMVVPGSLAFSKADLFMRGTSSTAHGVLKSEFAVDFDADRAKAGLRAQLEKDSIAITGASVEAVVLTTNDTKQAIRSYVDAHFSGSKFTGGKGGRQARRRVSFAAAQSKLYNDVAAKGQYTGLVYSKFGKGHGPAGFVDFLMLHVRGGTVTADDGGWIRIPNKKVPGWQVGQVGNYPISDSRVFFRKSDDGKELYLLRAYGRGSNRAKKAGKIELLATLVKKLEFPATLTGIDEIARRRPEVFMSHFDAALRRERGQA